MHQNCGNKPGYGRKNPKKRLIVAIAAAAAAAAATTATAMAPKKGVKLPVAAKKKTREGCESLIREKAEAVWDWWGFAS